MFEKARGARVTIIKEPESADNSFLISRFKSNIRKFLMKQSAVSFRTIAEVVPPIAYGVVRLPFVIRGSAIWLF